MLRFSFLVAGVVSVAASTAQAKILPDNDLYKHDCLYCEVASGITEKDFNSVIDEVEGVYKEVVSELGGKLSIARRWTDSTVNANASQLFGTWYVNMYGGLARRPEVTKDGFTLVLCHEMGHHLAGFPFVSGWAANEGESDFFATHKCAVRLWSEQRDENAKARATVPDVAKAKCDDLWKTQSEQDLCYRTMNAGKSLADLLGALRGQKPDLSKHDDSKVGETYDGHPDAQCRLDTYAAGATCTAEYDIHVIPAKSQGNSLKGEQESSKWHCTKAGQYAEGLRPACWFKARL